MPKGKDCPLCKVPHKRKDKHGLEKNLYADRFYSCEKWVKLNLEERVNWLERVQGCVMCGDWTGSHQNKNCPVSQTPCGEQNCGKLHMKRLHGSVNKYCGAVRGGTVTVTCEDVSVTTLNCPRRCQNKGSEDTLGGDEPTREDIRKPTLWSLCT